MLAVSSRSPRKNMVEHPKMRGIFKAVPIGALIKINTKGKYIVNPPVRAVGTKCIFLSLGLSIAPSNSEIVSEGRYSALERKKLIKNKNKITGKIEPLQIININQVIQGEKTTPLNMYPKRLLICIIKLNLHEADLSFNF